MRGGEWGCVYRVVDARIRTELRPRNTHRGLRGEEAISRRKQNRSLKRWLASGDCRKRKFIAGREIGVSVSVRPGLRASGAPVGAGRRTDAGDPDEGPGEKREIKPTVGLGTPLRLGHVNIQGMKAVI